MSPSRGRGQHAGLDGSAVLHAAIELVDRDGLSALSMRRLGRELDVEAMALYHHFPSKDSLLDEMVGELVAQATVLEIGDGDWRTRLRNCGLTFYEKLSEHPQLVPLVLSRPAMTTGNLQAIESLVGSLCRAGFTPVHSLDIVYAVGRLVLIHAALSTETDPTGDPPDDPTAALGGVDPADYPLLTAAARASVGRSPTYRLEFALDAMLSGFAERAE